MDSIAPRDKQRVLVKKKLLNLFWRVIGPLPDQMYLFVKYATIYGRFPDFRSPQRFSELQQMRKIGDNDPIYPKVVDKDGAKDFIREKAGAQYVIPTYWVGTDFGGIDWNTIELPAVVKPTHASGVGCMLNTRSDVEELMRLRPEREWLSLDQTKFNRELVYKGVKPQIIIEKMLQNGGEPLNDIRFFTFRGDVAHIEMRVPHNGQMYEAAYSADWERLSLSMEFYPELPHELEQPQGLDEMLSVVRKLGRDLPFARIDLYNTIEGVFVGEITLYPAGGFETFEPDEYDFVLGDRLKKAMA